ncbi:MAG: hypothetical protein HGA31_03775 [Candidatus Moranbacteria bacterium]|nr:hypothetical protein [Candidatus Moranbacteria bacterium]
MKVLLNLLPERHRVSIRRKFYDRFFLRQAVILFCICVFYVGVLSSIFFAVWENRKSVEEMTNSQSSATAESRQLDQYETAFREANAISARSVRYYAGHLSWTQLLILLDNLIPDGISLTSLSTKDYRVFLSGTARTRDDFLGLESRLKGSECLSDFKEPVSNLFSSQNADFQVDFMVDMSCLKRSSDL